MPSTCAATFVGNIDAPVTLIEFGEYESEECAKANIDYVPMDTSVSFDKALMEYLLQRQRRF